MLKIDERTLRALEKAKRLVREAGIPGLVSASIGEKVIGGKPQGRVAIVFRVEEKRPVSMLRVEHVLPKQIDGIETDVKVMQIPTGPRPIPTVARAVDRTVRIRPAPCGYSEGHKRITAGTGGCQVRRRSNGERLRLSNAHVYRNENLGLSGDEITQPGPYDGGTVENDTIRVLVPPFIDLRYSEPSPCPVATAYAWVGDSLSRALGRMSRIVAQVTPTNYVDCALGKPVNDGDDVDEIEEVGVPKGIRQPQLDMLCQKSGRTTGLTTDGPITDLSWSGYVNYTGGLCWFEDQCAVTKAGFSSGGDSGSLILDKDRYAVLLLFAGDNTHTIGTPINMVLNALDVDLIVGT